MTRPPKPIVFCGSALSDLRTFQKNTQKTSRADIVLATQRLKNLIRELGP